MNLTDRETHFEFGENWNDYAKTVDGPRIESAIAGLRKLFPDGLTGQTFLDIGCGSGLHALAALSLGASSVTAIDIDENSVSTARALLAKFAPGARWSADVASVFNLSTATTGQFDVVYSWGVLHHSGDMWRAVECASRLVKPGGQFAIAIYSETTLDAMWKVEKRLYSRAPRAIQAVVRAVYTAALRARLVLSSSGPIQRGMNFSHDVHDWLGGYPYETASAGEIRRRVTALGLQEERSFPLPKSVGLFGAGCHEFVFARTN